MRKKTIAILFGLGFGLALIAALVYVIGIVGLVNTMANCSSSYSSSGYPQSTCDTSMPTGALAFLAVAGITALAGGVLSTISWVAVLIKQAQRQQWAWFVCTLLFHAICMLIWLIVEPEVPAAPQYAQVYQPQPGYPPAYPPDGSYPHTAYPPVEQPYYQDPYNRQ
jgi:hypothetical protein